LAGAKSFRRQRATPEPDGIYMTDVSVVIPTFRRCELLTEAIGSALAQQDVSVEIIVVDDSPEGSARDAVANLRDPRIQYVQSATPSGGRPALVRNEGWKKARGRFIHFLDDDDRVAGGYYRAAVAAFESHPECGVVFGQIRPFSEPESAALEFEQQFFRRAARRTRLWSRLGSRWALAANLLFMPTLLVNSACMIRREHVQSLDGYDANIMLNEDVDFFCRAIRAYGCRFLDQVVVHYRILPTSLMHGRTGNQKLIDSYQRMYARYRAKHGGIELLAMKILARTVMRVL
jgi:glycosyltransferase involved in cell wall biosynthesis